MITLLLSLLLSCSNNKKSNDSKEGIVEVCANIKERHQLIEGFGASDCWTLQFVGENWPEKKREKIARLLFSEEVDSQGNPKGIGLSQWRFNIGAGTAEQGEKSGIPNPWRRAECFMNGDGTYNWDKQMGQQWFLKAAKEMGVEKLLAFNNSAPVYFTNNRKGWSPGGIKYNLQDKYYEAYADFLIKVAAHFKETGLEFDYLSPFNEPQWDWKAPATQEGSPARNEDIAKLIRILAPKIKENGLNAELVIPEAAQLQFLNESGRYPERDNQLEAFFNDTSALYLGNLPEVRKSAMGHSYFTTNNNDTLIRVRQRLKEHIQSMGNGLDFWQSEYCILEDHEDIGGGNHRDLGMATALYVARVIHADLAIADATVWSWWTSVSPVDYKDGLVYIDRGQSGIQSKEDELLLQEDGFVRDSKLLWVMGNYARFVRPGMVRIEAWLSDKQPLEKQMDNLMVSAYEDSKKGEYVFVVVNYSMEDKKLSFESFCEENDLDDDDVTVYVTSEDKNLTKSTVPVDNIVVGKRSVQTFVFCK